MTVRNGRVPVNLINVHNQTITLHKGKTLGQLQPVISVVNMSAPSSQCHGKTVQKSSKLLNMNDVPEHMRDVLDEETLSELSDEQTHKVCETILDYPEGFVVPGGKTGRTEVADHGVDVQGNSPLSSDKNLGTWPSSKLLMSRLERCWKITSSSPVTAHGPAQLYLSQKGMVPSVSV